MSMISSPSGNRTEQQPVLMLVSHTHWDREWYLTFQQYRVKLIRLIDRLLNLLDRDSEYKFFMLDGQTIVLEDYLEVRPDRRADLERHIRAGRLQIGPWYILADQFLVSGEAHIQNLLRGLQTSAEFGSPMRVGYIPDPFGHTGQMPQILRGFGIDSAVFWRGVGPELGQVEYIWAAPDGTTVDGVWLPGNANIGGYSSALAWNKGPEAAMAQLPALKELVIDKSRSGITLLMNGNDHVEPSAQFPATLRQVQAALNEEEPAYRVVHGSLPAYLELARQSGVWKRPETPRHDGEFRDSRLAHLLPGVLSARMWIKQDNARIENLLERETGPALAWLASLPGQQEVFEAASLRGLYRTAWKYLLQNHPHDSICGCSIDQVHEEMRTRFDWAEQIGQELRQESWRTLATAIDTSYVEPKGLALVVTNTIPLKRTELVSLPITAPEGMLDVIITDSDGKTLPHRLSKPTKEMLFNMDIPASTLVGTVAQAGDDGRIMDYTMASIEFRNGAEHNVMDVDIQAIYQSASPTDPELMRSALAEATLMTTQAGIDTFRLTVYRQTGAQLEFLAEDVPPTGYKTFFMRPRHLNEKQPKPETPTQNGSIENEFYEVSVDEKTGLFSVLDKETGQTFNGLNRFRDGSDAGDEYNYSPATKDALIESLFAAPAIEVRRGTLESTILMDGALELPFSLSEDRQSRGSYKTICPVTVIARLVPGQRRIDFRVTFVNDVEDHRLQVLFPAPFAVTSAAAEQAFDVLERSTTLPAFDANWREDPVPTAPQKSFVSIYDPASKVGLSVINRGLPEYEIVHEGEKSAVALTLLRCVGWLSRADLSTRRDHAGPGLPTPGAQEKGTHTFHYALMPHKGEWLVAGAQAQAHAFNQPLSGITVTPGNPTPASLPVSTSFVEILPRVVALSTIKPSEDGRALILRLWNPATRDIPQAKVRFYRQPSRVSLVNLGEDQIVQELTIAEDGWLSFELPAKRIATLRVEF